MKTVIAGVLLVVGLGTAVLAPAPVVQAADELKCGVLPQGICNSAKQGDASNPEQTGVWLLLKMVILIMSAGAGILAVGGIIYGAVMYTSAGGNQEQVKKARTILTNVVIGIIAFAAMGALLNWLIPGGVF